jgi:hypothetical protein
MHMCWERDLAFGNVLYVQYFKINYDLVSWLNIVTLIFGVVKNPLRYHT